MLQDIKKPPTDHPQPKQNQPIISDPWQESQSSQTQKPLVSHWQIESTQSVIPPAGKPDALELPPPTFKAATSAKVLVEDELKIHREYRQLTDQVQDALTLLYWLETAA